MRRHLLIFTLLLALAGASRLGAEELWRGTSQVTFKGFSTLHDFEGTLPAVPLKVTVRDGAAGRIVSATSKVEVKQMSTRNEKRDRNMWSMLDEATHRFISVEVHDAEERTLHPSGQPGSMPITLDIAGHSSRVIGVVTNVSERPGAVSFDLAFPVSLTAFHLEPPKALAGLMKVKDRVEVTAHVTLHKEAR